MLIYLAWMTITTLFALERDDAIVQLEKVTKIHLMCLVTLCLLTDWKKVRQLTWVAVCCIAFYGLKGGIFTIINGGQFIVWGPPDSAIQDNNHLAVGLVMMLPLLYWLYIDARRIWLRLAIAFTALMSALSVFGSHSRSAFLAVAAMSLFMVIKTRHKLAVGLILALGAIAAVSLMPQSYWKRMGTIETYQSDASAMGRINAWKTGLAIADDRFTGGGFALYTRRVFARYAPDPENLHSSHSIYFQALGEHGWIGLALFLTILMYVWNRCRRVIVLTRNSSEGREQALLAKMIQVSIVGLAVGGAFVNIGNWDMIYYIAIIAIATFRCAERASRVGSVVAHAPATGVALPCVGRRLDPAAAGPFT
jgi:probable O-glycosylation ligase (exosortase A-associated)